MHASGDLIAKIEKAQRWPTEDLAKRCDAALATGGALNLLYPAVNAERRQSRRTANQSDAFATPGQLGDLMVSALGSGCLPSGGPDRWSRQTLHLPAGELLAATSVEAWTVPAIDQRATDLAAIVPPREYGRPGDLLMVAEGREETSRFYAADLDRSRPPVERAVAVPSAYLLDDFTMGLLWAALALDTRLQADDRPLAESLEQTPPERLWGDGATLAGADLSTASRSWLGSYACARFIAAHLDPRAGVPQFWTRERRGEEAAAWLFFDHKLSYLRSMHDEGADRRTPMARVFCLPEATAATGPRAERVLLVLAAALMEAMGVRVHASSEPDYQSVEGFVQAADGTVLMANWLHTDQVCHTDVIGSRGAARSYRDALGFAQAHSVIAADTPRGRLRHLADYLHIDWGWLTSRAAQVSTVGVSGLVYPRSRLLSTLGVDTACRFLGHQAATATNAPSPLA